jgi:hypothetical protein
MEEAKKLNEIVDCPDFKTPSDVERFFIAYTQLIWDYKMVGTIYDYYHDDIVIHVENGKDIVGVEAVVKDTIIRMNAMPDLKIKFIDIFAEGNEENGYKFIQVTYHEGTSLGHSQFGPPTGEKLNENNFMNMCECLVKKINGKWKVVEEWGAQSNKKLNSVLKGKAD